MKQLVLLSGKGGTGKTTVAASFVMLAQELVPPTPGAAHAVAFADCDVDACNLHLVFSQGKTLLEEEYRAGRRAVINQSRCIHCGRCEQNCRFGAVRNSVVNPYQCDGCGVCEYQCPVDDEGNKAIKMIDQVLGNCRVVETPQGIFSTAQLRTGAGNSGRLVARVKELLQAHTRGEKLAIIDGSPGIGSAVLAAIDGADFVLLVTEPSRSALCDLERMVQVLRRGQTPFAVCINKADLVPACTQEILSWCGQNRVMVLGQVPNDPLTIKAINHGRTLTEYPASIAAQKLRDVFWKVMEQMDMEMV